ncbi:MAG: tetratricopeptide repeat protein, partial [Gammaproteobacteria bacterium]
MTARPLILLLCLHLGLGLSACSSPRERQGTIAELKPRDYSFEKTQLPPIEEPRVIEQYRDFLELTPTEPMYSEAMRRLADLELETSELTAINARDIERASTQIEAAIRLYQTYLSTYPESPKNAMVLYQLARAYELNNDPDHAMMALNRIANRYADFELIDEVQFRRGETLFVLREYEDAGQAYHSVIADHPDSLYYEKALYKYGWTHFKKTRYTEALNAFFTLLDRKYLQGVMLADGPAPDLPRTDREFLEDTLRVVSLAFSHQEGRESLANYFRDQGARSYEPLIYRHLAKLYLDRERIHDAASTYFAFVDRFPNSPLAPQFHQAAIDAYIKGNFPSLVLPAKEQFVQRYGVQSPFWQVQTEEVRQRVKPLLAAHLRDLATHYHAAARQDKKPATFQIAAQWYATYIKSFPDDPGAAEMNFLLAECLFDGQRFAEAVSEYEKTAYHYPPHAKNAEAGYAALLAYVQAARLLPAEQRPLWQEKKISSALKFTERFAQDRQVPAVLTRTAEELFALQHYARASDVARRLLLLPQGSTPALEKTAWLVHAHAQFELGEFAEAEKAYQSVLTYLPARDPQRNAVNDRLAASVYKQAEQERGKGALALAAGHFLRVKQVVPGSALVINAEYDAATVLIETQDWSRAGQVLERFRQQYPRHPLQAGVTEKLALVYTQSGQGLKAAGEMERLALNASDRNYRQEMIWQAAGLYKDGGELARAMALYERYVKEFPQQLPQSMEARSYLAQHAQQQRDAKRWGYWLNEIIKADSAAGPQRTDRTRSLAAEATLVLGDRVGQGGPRRAPALLEQDVDDPVE